MTCATKNLNKGCLQITGLRFEPGTYGAAYKTATFRANLMFGHMSGLVVCALGGRAGMVEMCVSLYVLEK
jgi:hypothetical protein